MGCSRPRIKVKVSVLYVEVMGVHGKGRVDRRDEIGLMRAESCLCSASTPKTYQGPERILFCSCRIDRLPDWQPLQICTSSAFTQAPTPARSGHTRAGSR